MLTNTLSSDHVRQKEAARSVNRQIFAPASPNALGAANADFSYQYDRARSRANLRSFVERSPTPGAKAAMEEMISAQPNLLDDLRVGIRPYGLDTYNVADAYAFWMINSWLVANKRDDDPSPGTIAIVKRQVRNAFAATNEFAATRNSDRQQYAEALLLQSTMLASAFEQWKDDPKMLDQLADAARKGAQASDLNLSLITLTRNGFVPRKGADASGAIGDKAGAAKATEGNARAEVQDKGESSGLGLALAGGAGLGLTLLGGLAFMRRGPF